MLLNISKTRISISYRLALSDLPAALKRTPLALRGVLFPTPSHPPSVQRSSFSTSIISAACPFTEAVSLSLFVKENLQQATSSLLESRVLTPKTSVSSDFWDTWTVWTDFFEFQQNQSTSAVFKVSRTCQRSKKSAGKVSETQNHCLPGKFCFFRNLV